MNNVRAMSLLFAALNMAFDKNVRLGGGNITRDFSNGEKSLVSVIAGLIKMTGKTEKEIMREFRDAFSSFQTYEKEA